MKFEFNYEKKKLNAKEKKKTENERSQIANSEAHVPVKVNTTQYLWEADSDGIPASSESALPIKCQMQTHTSDVPILIGAPSPFACFTGVIKSVGINYNLKNFTK